MDDRMWEKLRRRARREKIWKPVYWTMAALDTPFMCWYALRGQWGHALFDASAVILLVVAASLYVPLVTIEEALDGSDE